MLRRQLLGVVAFVMCAVSAGPVRATGGEITLTGSYCPARGDLPSGFAFGTFAGMRLWGPVGLGTELSSRWLSSDVIRIAGRGHPGGGPETQLVYILRNGSVEPFPLYLHLYTSADAGPLLALFGVGGGYQMAFVQGDAFTTQIFGGWGGTVWASLHERIRSREPGMALGVGFEARYHAGTVRRDAFDSVLATRVRQEIDVTGLSLGLTIRMSFAR